MSSPYINTPKTPYQERDSYNKETGTYIDKSGLGYSVAPEKVNVLKEQVNKTYVVGDGKPLAAGGRSRSKKKKTKTESVQTNMSPSTTQSNSSQGGEVSPVTPMPRSISSFSSPSREQQARMLAQTQQTQSTRTDIKPDTQIKGMFTNKPGTYESDKSTPFQRNYAESRQTFVEKISQGESEPLTYKDIAKVGGYTGIAFGVGAVKGGVSAVKDVATLQIIPKTTTFLTETISNPKGVYSQIKSDFAKNPAGFVGEQVGYGVVTGKVFKGIKTGEITEVVKPINVPGAVTKRGSFAESGQRLSSGLLKGTDYVGVLIVSAKQKIESYDYSSLRINKKGQVNNPNKRRLSKAEQRYQSRTGYTKADVRKQPKPSQGGTTTQTFTQKDLMRNQDLQSRASKFNYPDNKLGEYSKFSLVGTPEKKGTEIYRTITETGQPVKAERPFYKPAQDNILTTKKKQRNVYENDLSNQQKLNVPKVSSQSTTKNVDIGLTSGDLSLTQKIKVKIKYVYDNTKKAKLNPKIPEPKKINPANGQVIELISNINEKGAEVFAPVSEPLRTTLKGGFRAGGKLRDEIIARAKAKREAQLKEIALREEAQRQRDTLPATTEARNLFNNQRQSSSGQIYAEPQSLENVGNPFKSISSLKRKNPLQNKYYVYTNAGEIAYAPRVSPAQLINTKTTTLNLPGQTYVPRITQRNIPSQINAPAQVTSPYNILDQYSPTSLSQVQLQTQTPGQVIGGKLAETTISNTGQLPGQIIGGKLGETTISDTGQIISPKVITIPGKITPSIGRGGTEGGSSPRTPSPQPQPREDNVFKPITTRPVFVPQTLTRPQRPVVLPKAFYRPQKQETGAGFDVYVRERGTFVKITDKPLSRGEAINFGAYRVSNTARASFKLVKSKSGRLGVFKGERIKRERFTEKKNDLFVEKAKFRIKSRGELEEITFKGIRAKKQKSIWRRVI